MRRLIVILAPPDQRRRRVAGADPGAKPRHLLHRHGRRAVDALRRSHRRVAAGGYRQRRRPRPRAHRRDAAHRWRHARSITCGRRTTTAITSARCSKLAKQFPVGHFYDHGKPHPNDRIVSSHFSPAYESLSAGKRTIVKPGDKVKMTGLDITAVASANQFIRTNLPGGGSQNASCAGVKQKDESAYPDPDNGESAGFVLTYGRFRTIDLGDLTWNGELDLMCPTNRIGTVDLYLTSHHGLEKSGSPALVQALRPRVVVMNNGTRKGGTPEAFARACRRPSASRTCGSCTGRTTPASRTRRPFHRERRRQRDDRGRAHGPAAGAARPGARSAGSRRSAADCRAPSAALSASPAVVPSRAVRVRQVI